MRKVLFSSVVLFIMLSQPAYAEQTGMIQTGELIVHFEEPLSPAAEEVADIYARLKVELEGTLGWKVDFRPTVLLIKNRQTFERMAGSALVVAFAIPQRKLVVIDYSKVNTRPFSLRTILKHELCHLLLHRHIRGSNLPKWLDEGISQWVSDGIAEIILDRKGSVFDEAILSGNYISLDLLSEGFPEDRRSLFLAYEESKSLVEFINSRFGGNGILRILNYLKEGDEVEAAIQKGLSIPLDELERRWQSHLGKKTSWFTYLVTNLYVILFFLAALITIWGFVRVLMKKRSYEGGGDDYPWH